MGIWFALEAGSTVTIVNGATGCLFPTHRGRDLHKIRDRRARRCSMSQGMLPCSAGYETGIQECSGRAENAPGRIPEQNDEVSGPLWLKVESQSCARAPNQSLLDGASVEADA